MITPSDIQDKVFDKAMRGYNADQVDQFLDELTEDLQAILAENAQLQEQLEAAKTKLNEYKAQDGAVLKTLESAKALMNDISASAEKRADIITKNAELDADRMLRAARENVERLKEEEQNLAFRVNSIKNRFKNILQAELDRFDTLNQDILGTLGIVSESSEEFAKAAEAAEQPASVLAAQEAMKLAKGELPEYARVAAANIKERDYDKLIAAWKEEIRKAFLRG
mgnify:CR=1 FL=1